MRKTHAMPPDPARSQLMTAFPTVASLVILTVSLGFWTPALADAAAPVRLSLQEERLREPEEDWYGVYVAGTKIGFLHAGFAPSREDGEPVLVFDLEMGMKVRALGLKVEIEVSERLVFAGRPPYGLLGGESDLKQGAFRRGVRVEKDGARFLAHITEAGSPRTMDLGELDYTAEDALTPETWFLQPRRVGDRLVARSFEVLELQSSIDTYEVESVRESMADGVPVGYYDVRHSSSIMGDVGTFRFDRRGRLLSGHLGQGMEIRLESREQARDLDYEADLFVLGMAEVDRPLGDASRITSMVLKVESEQPGRLPDGPRQSVVRNEEAGTTILRLGQRHGRESAVAPGEREENLEETVAYPTRRPEIAALLKEALGEASEPWEKVQALVAYVRDFIEDSYTAQPLTVMDVLRVRKGDCTEHASLFTTLARAAGIPAREVSGLIYMGDTHQAFGGHAWNEVLLDGRWVPVDPLWGETEINATHISFGPASGEDAGVFAFLSHYAFELEQVERRPE